MSTYEITVDIRVVEGPSRWQQIPPASPDPPFLPLPSVSVLREYCRISSDRERAREQDSQKGWQAKKGRKACQLLQLYTGFRS